jgi:hypothetical protein
MEKPTEHNKGFRQLLNGLLEGQLTARQVRQLERTIQANPEAMKLYVDIVTLTVGLRKYSQTQRGAMKEVFEQQKPDESALWRTLANDEKQAPTIKIVKKRNWLRWKPKTVAIRPKEQNIERVRRNISRRPIVTLIVSSAALILLLVYIQLFPSQTMATLGDSVNAVWDNPSNEFQKGNGLYPVSRQQVLKKGFVQVRFANGAEVIFEAPCQFVLESKEQLFLKQGKVFVKVSKEAIGFTVRTPNCRIIDLGTEFGVSVAKDGGSQLEMFVGKASLIAESAGQKKLSELVLAGQACNVEAKTGKISTAPFVQRQFAQRIDSGTHIIWRGEKNLSLADFIAGGDGLHTKPQGFLNPINGAIEKDTKDLTYEERINPPQTYTPVPSSPFIDGIFVPNGKNGPVKVSSAGHRFAFPQTSATIWCRVETTTYYVTDKNEGSQFPGEGATPRSSFYLHADTGVTFNLDAIRKAYPDMKIKGFRTRYGIRYENILRYNKMDFWVLVDGQSRHEQRAKIGDRKMEDAYVPLSDTDRFLTLAATESDDTLKYDWGVFVNPVIELVASNTTDN